MPTCPSCSATIDADADVCAACGAVLGSLAVGADTSSGAPTLPMFGEDSEPLVRRSDSMIGREIIGQYVIVKKLGEGGMGEVYLADQPSIGRQVAIKIVHAQAPERGRDELIARFRNEAKAAASLESPHIVQIFNWGALEDGTSFMAMEYLSGRTLAEVVREHGALEPERAVAICVQVCVALSEAHAAGIVHRDLKPSNIMLIERNEPSYARSHAGAGPSRELSDFVKVLDFGVAKLEGSDITRSGAMFGTPQYMSPEQLRGEPIDGRSDLYSLGVMLFELLVGELPFSSPTAIGFVTAHLYQQPPKLPRGIPPALAEIVAMLLAKDASERPPDAAAVARELEAALAGRSITARRRQRKRTLRSAAGIASLTIAVALLAATGYGVWRWWTERDQAHQAELDRERERAAALEQRLAEQAVAIDKIRADAALADAQMQNTQLVREQRQAVVERKVEAPPLDEKTRVMLTRTRTQLEAELREVVEQRRIPPSAVTDLWASRDALFASVDAGERTDAELREQLAGMIELYRKNFEREAVGDDLSMAELEPRFLQMPTRDELDIAARQAMIDAIHETYDRKQLPEVDRAYFKQLALAKLIREQMLGTEFPTLAKPKPPERPDPEVVEPLEPLPELPPPELEPDEPPPPLPEL